jgi:hypothetical protein
MSLSSRENLDLEGKRHGHESFGTNLTLDQRYVPELRTWQHSETSLSGRLTNHAKSDKIVLGISKQ